MAGLVVRICPPTAFNFDNLSNSGGVPMVFPLATRINILGFEFQYLQVRTHVLNLNQVQGDSMTVDAASSGYTTDDPNDEFATSQLLAAVSLSATPSLPNIQVTQLFGSSEFVNVRLSAQRGGAGNPPLNAVVSVDLVLKTAAAFAPQRQMQGTYAGYFRIQ